MRVLVVHNRYRQAGGEERALELHLAALERAGIPHALLERRSTGTGRVRAARALLRGGEDEREVDDAARRLRATVVHFHNMLPLFGPRSLEAARGAGARVVLQLHNFRLFCSIAVAFRDGEPCFRCRGRFTLPGAALNCRGSLAQSAVYASALSLHQPAVFGAVDRFVTLSGYARGQLIRLGVPADRLDVLPNYLPESDLVERSAAEHGGYAVIASRLSEEKGIETAVEAAALAGIPLKIAGSGPLEQRLRGGPAELLGAIPREEVRSLLDGAAFALVPSVGGDVMPYSALEAMGRGLPVLASHSGSLPELVGAERCVPRRDAPALARAMRLLWDDPPRRRQEGEQLLGRVRTSYGERRYLDGLTGLYG